MDFMSDALLTGRRLRTLNIIDDFNREALAITVATALPTPRVVAILEQVVSVRGYPERVRLDNGPEFTAQALHNWDKPMASSSTSFNPVARRKTPTLSVSTAPIARRSWTFICLAQFRRHKPSPMTGLSSTINNVRMKP